MSKSVLDGNNLYGPYCTTLVPAFRVNGVNSQGVVQPWIAHNEKFTIFHKIAISYECPVLSFRAWGAESSGIAIVAIVILVCDTQKVIWIICWANSSHYINTRGPSIAIRVVGLVGCKS